MSTVIAIHFGFATIWLGCVVTEALFERALLAGNRSAHLTLADLHVRVDKFIEIPAILVVLATGVWMWLNATPTSASFYVMLSSGLVAIAANFYCVFLVFKRRDAAHSKSWDEFDRLDHLQHKIGAIVLFGLLAALVSGVVGRG
jgi:uncharacterized membrane protein